MAATTVKRGRIDTSSVIGVDNSLPLFNVENRAGKRAVLRDCVLSYDLTANHATTPRTLFALAVLSRGTIQGLFPAGQPNYFFYEYDALGNVQTIDPADAQFVVQNLDQAVAYQNNQFHVLVAGLTGDFYARWAKLRYAFQMNMHTGSETFYIGSIPLPSDQGGLDLCMPFVTWWESISAKSTPAAYATNENLFTQITCRYSFSCWVDYVDV